MSKRKKPLNNVFPEDPEKPLEYDASNPSPSTEISKESQLLEIEDASSEDAETLRKKEVRTQTTSKDECFERNRIKSQLSNRGGESYQSCFRS